MLNNKRILITGGTGSFGKKCAEIILKRYKPEKIITQLSQKKISYEALIYEDFNVKI